MNPTATELLSFIAASPSAFHTVKTVSELLTADGYTPLHEGDSPALLPGGKYFVTRNQSSLIAFRVPQSGKLTSFMIAAAHSDSPSFKIKHNAESDAAGAIRVMPPCMGIGQAAGTAAAMAVADKVDARALDVGKLRQQLRADNVMLDDIGENK